MYRGALLSSLPFLLLLAACPIRAQQDKAAPLKQALALQDLVQQTIRAAEPAVACILVSRSDAYARYGQGPTPDNPGTLGAFDPVALESYLTRMSVKQPERDRIRLRLDLADPAHVPESYGSGVVIDTGGLVLTNYHVVRDATKLFVRVPGSPGSYADVLAGDPRSDLAVLHLLGPKQSYKALPLAPGGQVDRGQFVIALANPFAVGFRDGQASASFGIISNVRRRPAAGPREAEHAKTLHEYGTLLQTDVRLNLGCSGGALLNLQGELIGLTTSLAAVQGSDAPGGFAVPLSAGLLRIIEVLKRGEEVDYGFLGISFERKAASATGVVVSDVTPGSPADHKVAAKDVILAVNGQPVRTGDDLFLVLGTLLAGSQITLDVQQAASRQRVQVEVRLAKYYVPGKRIATSKAPRPFFRGLRVDYTSLLVQQPPRARAPQRIPSGVLVSEVQPDSPAATALLHAGEVVTHVNGRPVDTPAAFYHEVAGRSGPVELTLAGARPGQPAPKVVLN
jgi:S1-C subfamily serine protease